MKKLKLHHMILLGMFIGLIAGGLLNVSQKQMDPEIFQNSLWWINLFGKDLFIGSLKMIIAPLIFSSIVAGICSLPSMDDLGKIGVKTLKRLLMTKLNYFM